LTSEDDLVALLKPAVLQPVSGDTAIPYSAQDFRATLLSAMFSREGVYDLRGGHLKVAQRALGANMTVEVAAGRAAIQGDDASDQGMYAVTNTTAYSLAVPAPPGSGSRTHRVVAQLRDRSANAAYAANTYDWLPMLLPDTGTGVPAEPASAITLSTVTVPAGAGSIVNSMISDARKRASVGTAAVDGLMGAFYSGYSPNDATRPCRWSVNPDGWVQLSGFLRWVEIPTTVPAGEQRTMGGTPLADPAVKPPGIRDFVGASIFGPVHYAVYPDGRIYHRFQQAVTYQTNGSWFSFDGCFYRI
jgi:hypothetical protein